MQIIDSTGREVYGGKRQMRVRMVHGVFYEGVEGGILLVGQEYDVPDSFGVQLIYSGRAVQVPPAPVEAAASPVPAQPVRAETSADVPVRSQPAAHASRKRSRT